MMNDKKREQELAGSAAKKPKVAMPAAAATEPAPADTGPAATTNADLVPEGEPSLPAPAPLEGPKAKRQKLDRNTYGTTRQEKIDFIRNLNIMTIPDQLSSDAKPSP